MILGSERIQNLNESEDGDEGRYREKESESMSVPSSPVIRISSKRRTKPHSMRFGMTMYVKRDLTLAPLQESQQEEDLPGPILVGDTDFNKTFEGRVLSTDKAIEEGDAEKRKGSNLDRFDLHSVTRESAGTQIDFPDVQHELKDEDEVVFEQEQPRAPLGAKNNHPA